MKFKIFVRTLGPILLVALILWPPFDKLSGRLLIYIGVVGWLLFRFFTNKRLYLTGLTAVDEQIEFRLVTAQLMNKTVRFNVAEIEGMQISQANFPYKYYGALRIHAGEQWHTFLIIDKRTFERAEQVAANANVSLMH